MKRLAAIFVVAAGLSAVAPVGASAATLGGGSDHCHTSAWPLTLLLMPYCE